MLSHPHPLFGAPHWLTLVCAVAGVSASTQVQARSDPLSARVMTRDLDLATSIGRKTLDRRIRLAARRVCTPPGDSLAVKIAMRAPYRRCLAGAIADAAASRAKAIEQAFVARQSAIAGNIA